MHWWTMIKGEEEDVAEKETEGEEGCRDKISYRNKYNNEKQKEI